MIAHGHWWRKRWLGHGPQAQIIREEGTHSSEDHGDHHHHMAGAIIIIIIIIMIIIIIIIIVIIIDIMILILRLILVIMPHCDGHGVQAERRYKEVA